MNKQPDSDETTSSNRFPSTGFVAALILIFLLIFVVLPRQESDPKVARYSVALNGISALGYTLDVFEVDNGYYPPDSNGLKYLMQAPPGATNWHGPYLERAIPKDPGVTITFMNAPVGTIPRDLTSAWLDPTEKFTATGHKDEFTK